ncbi:MAG TPA: glycosyltransferase [Vicinamibacterales bacterium]|nr:glycosyltransferase [Vicinamibacterales bacterium]
MRIAFDGTALRPGRTGVGYYTEHLLHHLARTAVNDELIVLSNRAIDTTAPLPQRVRVATPARRVPRMVWMQTVAPTALRHVDADVVHFTNGMLPLLSPAPTVVTIHDMSLRLYPRYHPARRVLLNRPLVDLAARRADAIITPSHSAKRDIVRFYDIDPARVHVVYEAAAPSFRRVDDPVELERVRQRYRLDERIILYVGTIEPRKNLPKLIDAFAAQRKAGALSHQLVCVGPYGWLSRGIEQQIARANIAHAINFTGYVPFEDLPALYTLAEFFVYPSMYEGFGLPVIEAMACGAPVITGGSGALAEIGGDAMMPLDRVDADVLGRALVTLADSRSYREALSGAGLERSARFSWDRAAHESLEIYRETGRLRTAAISPRRTAAQAAAQPAVSAHAAALSTTPHLERASRLVETAVNRTDVLFGQAYFLRFDPKLWEAQQPYAPLGALYAAACVRERGYRVALFDAMLAASEIEWAAALDRHTPRFAVIYEDNFNYLSKMCLLRMRQAALTMIDAARARGITTIVAGADATDHPATYLDRGADAVVAGEGEVTLVELLDALAGTDRRAVHEIDGLWLRHPDGRVARTRPREIIRGLDRLPFPAWDLVDVDRYRAIWRARHGYFSMNLVTTRGCPYHCNWCAKPIYGQRYTARSPEHVAAEIAWLKTTYQPDHLWIADDIFGLKPGWIEQFAALLAARDAVIPFKCLLRADQVSESVAGALKAAGCRTAWLGAESGSQRILDAMEKGIRVDQIMRATRLLRGAGVEVGFFLQFGYPGETRDDIDRTLEMVRACAPDDIGVSVSYPLPGTTFYQRVQAQLGQKQNWVDSNDLAMMYHATYVADFYRALHALVHAEFRARKSAALVARAAARPWQIGRRHARAAAHALYHGLQVPTLRRRLNRLARLTAAVPPTPLIPLLSPQAAAMPTDQSSFK